MAKKNWKKLIGLPMILIIIAGLMVTPAMAQDEESSPDPGNAMEQMQQMINQAVQNGKITQEQAGKLLGMVEDGELSDGNAFRSLIRHNVQWQGSHEVDPAQFTERLNHAVADGKLTQEQANRCLAAVENGDVPRGFGLRGGSQGGGQAGGNIDSEQMAARIAQAVQAGKMTQAQGEQCLSAVEDGDQQNTNRFNSCIRNRIRWQGSHEIDPVECAARLAQAVADGKLTQEQANRCLAAVENGDVPRGFGFRGGDGGEGQGQGNGTGAGDAGQSDGEGQMTQGQGNIGNSDSPDGFGPGSGSRSFSKQGG